MMKVKSLDDTFIYSTLYKSNSIGNEISKVIKDGKRLTEDDIKEAFLIIEKNFKYPLKHIILDKVRKGEIQLIFAPENTRIPTGMPFFLLRDASSNVIPVVVVSTYGTMNKDNNYVKIDAKKLYCMLEGAQLAKIYIEDNRVISKQSSIITNGSIIYANIFARVLNRKYSLNIDKIKHSKVIFLASKFFLLNVLGMSDNEMVFNYAVKNCVNGNHMLLKEIDRMINEEEYKDLSTFINALKKDNIGLNFSDLTVRGFLETYINMYDQSTLLALEYFPYFVYMIIGVVNGAYINNQYILEDIVEKHGPKLYMSLVHMVIN